MTTLIFNALVGVGIITLLVLLIIGVSIAILSNPEDN